MLFLFCLMPILVQGMREDRILFVRNNTVHLSQSEKHIQEPIGCICPARSWPLKSGFGQCEKARDQTGKTIEFLLRKTGSCNVKQKKFYGCNNEAIMEPHGCCSSYHSDLFVPSNGKQYFYKGKIATCNPGNFRFQQISLKHLDMMLCLLFYVLMVVQGADVVRRKRGYVISEPEQEHFKWINATVPYCRSHHFSNYDWRMVEDAIAEIMTKSCIQFVSRGRHCSGDVCKPRSDNMKEFRMLSFTRKYPTCFSQSKSSKRHLSCKRINLGLRCLERPTILHEIMHALGFAHEHSRHDRDQYVTVHKQNVNEPTWTQEYIDLNYDISNGTLDVSNTKFDYESIMLYNYCPMMQEVISPRHLDPDHWNTQPVTLSKIDVLELNTIYECDVCINYDDDIKCTRWAITGTCGLVYMQKYCRKACGICSDRK